MSDIFLMKSLSLSISFTVMSHNCYYTCNDFFKKSNQIERVTLFLFGDEEGGLKNFGFLTVCFSESYSQLQHAVCKFEMWDYMIKMLNILKAVPSNPFDHRPAYHRQKNDLSCVSHRSEENNCKSVWVTLTPYDTFCGHLPLLYSCVFLFAHYYFFQLTHAL